MENKIIVTIGRQFGSGGREIGQKLAEMLGIAYYDKELMAMAAKDSGIAVGHYPVVSRKAIVCDGRSLCRLYFT